MDPTWVTFGAEKTVTVCVATSIGPECDPLHKRNVEELSSPGLGSSLR